MQLVITAGTYLLFVITTYSQHQYVGRQRDAAAQGQAYRSRHRHAVRTRAGSTAAITSTAPGLPLNWPCTSLPLFSSARFHCIDLSLRARDRPSSPRRRNPHYDAAAWGWGWHPGHLPAGPIRRHVGLSLCLIKPPSGTGAPYA